MKKTLLFIITLLIFSFSFSQVNIKNVQALSNINNTIINDINNPQALGGDSVIVLWEEDFANQIPENVTVENIGGYGDWIWSTESTQGQWGTNAGLIESLTADNGFMILDADWFNTYPNNGVEDGAVGENAVNASLILGPIDLSSSETNALVLQFYSYYRICCFAAGNGANDLNVYTQTIGKVTSNNKLIINNLIDINRDLLHDAYYDSLKDIME